jgi:hypothetical protein
MGEFSEPRQLVDAVKRLRDKGYRTVDAYSPYPIPEVSAALGLPRSKVPLFALLGGLGGAALGYSMQWFCNAYDWVINVGNRPPHAPPSFIPITFELGVLSSAFAIIFGLFALFRFPEPYHPVFEVEGFKRASLDRFWVSVESEESVDPRAVAADLRDIGAEQVSVVEGAP